MRANALIQKRERIVTQLDACRDAVTDWFEQFEDTDPSISDIARLEGMMTERRRYYAELEEADNRLIDGLLTTRTIKASKVIA